MAGILKFYCRNKLPFFSLLIFSVIFISFFYGKILLNPGGYLFSDSGDGIKNYYTYAYHISHDSAYLGFEGMNYPYGEHFLYTDCHPALANAFKFLGNYSPLFVDHCIGILNMLMIVSIFLTFFISYQLLRELKIEQWFSVIFAISITLLAPQIFRLEGHFALSYSVAIPLSWLLLLKFYNSTKPGRFFIMLLLNNMFWLFIHAYLGVIVIFFLLMVVVFKTLFGNGGKFRIRTFAAELLTGLFPLIFYYLFTVLTDPFTGRTDNPSGFFLYNAEFDDVFIPHHRPLRPIFDFISGNAINLKWEAWSYVGFSGTVVFLTLILSMIFGLIKKKYGEFSRFWFGNKTISTSLLAAFVVLLFAMGFPFVQFPALVDWFPYIKQFRATGRFAWPFYFVFMAFVATILQTYFQNSKKHLTGFVLIGGVFLLNIAEAIPYHIQVSRQISGKNNLFSKDQLSGDFQKAIATVDAQDYQAVITLPFYYYGSESYARPRDEEAVKTSLIFSFHTGIPNVCANLTRTPVEASKNIVQLVSPDFYSKYIQQDIPNSKPFLVLKINKDMSPYEKTLLNKAKPLGNFNTFSMYALEYVDLFSNSAVKYFDLFHEKKSDLFSRDAFQISDSASFLFYQDFENRMSEIHFRGKGAFVGEKKGKNTFAEFQPGTFKSGETYHFSIWMYNGMKDALNLWFRFIVEEWNPKTNSWQTTTFFPEHSEVIFGDWSLVEGNYSVESPDSYVYFATKGKENSKAGLFADDLLITSGGVDVFKYSADTLFYNNHMIINPTPSDK
ncbi:MAG: hypothetical protein K9H16_05840 [Bacteroidales bacterium]|nr:hypothetical protein [Bacteroidales bacterium]